MFKARQEKQICVAVNNSKQAGDIKFVNAMVKLSDNCGGGCCIFQLVQEEENTRSLLPENPFQFRHFGASSFIALVEFLERENKTVSLHRLVYLISNIESKWGNAECFWQFLVFLCLRTSIISLIGQGTPEALPIKRDMNLV